MWHLLLIGCGPAPEPAPQTCAIEGELSNAVGRVEVFAEDVKVRHMRTWKGKFEGVAYCDALVWAERRDGLLKTASPRFPATGLPSPLPLPPERAGGLWVEIAYESDVVVRVLPGGPEDRLWAGDRLVAVDGVPFTGLPIPWGAEGTIAKVAVERNGSRQLVSVTRRFLPDPELGVLEDGSPGPPHLFLGGQLCEQVQTGGPEMHEIERMARLDLVDDPWDREAQAVLYTIAVCRESL